MITKQVSTYKVARLASDPKSEVCIQLYNNQSVSGTTVFSLCSLSYVVFFGGFVYEIVQGPTSINGIRYHKEEYLRNTKYYGKKLQSLFYEGIIQKSKILEVETKVVLSKKR